MGMTNSAAELRRQAAEWQDEANASVRAAAEAVREVAKSTAEVARLRKGADALKTARGRADRARRIATAEGLRADWVAEHEAREARIVEAQAMVRVMLNDADRVEAAAELRAEAARAEQDDDGGPEDGCPGCNMLRISGHVCHETGCPDAWRTRPAECFECGATVEPTRNPRPLCADCEVDLAEGPDENECQDCGAELDRDCHGRPRCPDCDGPGPYCDDGPGPDDDGGPARAPGPDTADRAEFDRTVLGTLDRGAFVCLTCAPAPGPDACRVYGINLAPYSQTCHRCGRLVLDGLRKADGSGPLDVFDPPAPAGASGPAASGRRAVRCAAGRARGYGSGSVSY